MAAPTILCGQSGYGLDGTVAPYPYAWDIINVYTDSIISRPGVENGWSFSVVSGRILVQAPTSGTYFNSGGLYRVRTMQGPGGTALSTTFRVATAAENAQETQQVVQNTQTVVLGYPINYSNTTAVYNPNETFIGTNGSGGWEIVDLGAGPGTSRRLRVKTPNSFPAGASGYSALFGTAVTSWRASFDILATAPVVPPPNEQWGQGVEIRLYDKSGKRRRLPSFQPQDANWTIEPQGGYGDFSLSIAARPDELTSIAAGDRIEIFKFSTRQYRGYVGDITRSEDEPATLTLSGYGRILDLERMVLDAVYQRPQVVDLSDLFAEIAADVQSRYPAIAIETATIGVSIATLDCRNKTAREALSDLCATAPSACHFGFDVDDYGRDRLYLRKIELSAADTTITIPGKNVGHREVVQSVSDVVNAVVVEGGQPTYPQLIPNGSFEVLSKFSDDSGGSGNLLLNPSFEISTNQNSTANWTFSGGASAKKNGGQEAGAYAGDWAIELDQQNEKISQTQTSPTIPLVSGHDYTFGIWSRPENNAVITTPSTAPVATATLYWRNSGGTYISAGTFSVKAEVSAYRQYEGTFRAPAGVTGFRVEIEKTAGSTGAGRGMLLDSAYLFDNSSLIASGWGIRTQGTAVVQAVSWAARGANHGRNCLYLSASATDSDSNDIHVRLTPSYFVEVTGGQKFRFNCRFRGVNATVFTPKMEMQWRWYESNGTTTGTLQRYAIPSQQAGTWTFSESLLQAPGQAIKGEFWIAIRGSGEVLLDAISLRDAAENEAAYLPEGNFQARFTATELVSSAENAEVNGSIATYGLRERVERFDGVATFADARTVAKGYLIANASGLPAPSIDLYDDHRPLWIGYRVRLSGAAGAAYSTRILPVMRVNGSIGNDGLLTHSLELSRPIPTDEELIARLAKDRSRAASSTVASNAAATTSVPTGSSSSSGSSTVAGVATVNGISGAVAVTGLGGITASTSGSTVTLDGSGTKYQGAAGSIPFVSSSGTLTESNSTFFRDASGRIGIGTNAPNAPLHVRSNGADLPLFETSAGSAGFRTFDTNGPVGGKSWTVATDASGGYIAFFATNDAITAITTTPLAVYRSGDVVSQGTIKGGAGYLAGDGTPGINATVPADAILQVKNGLIVGYT